MAVLTVDSLGRRPLLLGGVGSMVVALLALGGSQIALSGGAETWTSVAALLLYVGAYQARPFWACPLFCLMTLVMARSMRRNQQTC